MRCKKLWNLCLMAVVCAALAACTPIQQAAPDITAAGQKNEQTPALRTSAPESTPGKEQKNGLEVILSIKNSRGTADLKIGDTVQNSLEAYVNLSEHTPAQAEIDRLAEYGDETQEDGQDGFYGGPTAAGDIYEEVAVGFYNNQLNFIEIGDRSSGEIASEFTLLGKITNGMDYEDVRAVLGEGEEMPAPSDSTYQEFSYKTKSNGYDCNLVIRYESENRQIRHIGIYTEAKSK